MLKAPSLLPSTALLKPDPPKKRGWTDTRSFFCGGKVFDPTERQQLVRDSPLDLGVRHPALSSIFCCRRDREHSTSQIQGLISGRTLFFVAEEEGSFVLAKESI